MSRNPGAGLLAVVVAGIALLGSMAAVAQTVYKLIDKDGKVSYVQEPPKYYEGKVIRIDIDPNANKATLQAPDASRGGEPGVPGATKPGNQQTDKEQRLDAAHEKLEQAKKALADARENPGEGDIQRLGKVGGGARPVHTEEYDQRLADLERAVKEAEDELRNVEKGS